MNNFDCNSFVIPAQGTAVEATAKKPEGRILKEGDYRYEIKDIAEDVICWPSGNTSPKIVLTLEVEGLTLSHIDLVLSTSRKYLEILYDFAESIGFHTDHDLKIEWDCLKGVTGWAHIVPKQGKYKTLYNVTKWLPGRESSESAQAD